MKALHKRMEVMAQVNPCSVTSTDDSVLFLLCCCVLTHENFVQNQVTLGYLH